MKTIILTVLALTTNFFITNDIVDKFSIEGNWQTNAKDAQLNIYHVGEKFFGKIIWLKDPGKDTKNPTPELRNREIVGSIILTDFVYNGKDKWEGGKIYDPSGGKTYSCVMRLKNNNVLEIRGYIGISLLGRTEVWTRL